MNTRTTGRNMAKELPKRDRDGAAARMQARREADARTEDKNGWSVNDPNREPRGHPNGWQTGGRDENG